MAKYHERFCWDERKEKTNRKKHGISFDKAAEVLLDELADVYHLEEPDDEHSLCEYRHVTIGSHPACRGLVLWICWTRRGKTTRIIGARKATPRERKRHAEKVKQTYGL